MTIYTLMLKPSGNDQFMQLPVDNIEAAKKIAAKNLLMEWRIDGKISQAFLVGSDGTSERLINNFGEILTENEMRTKYPQRFSEEEY